MRIAISKSSSSAMSLGVLAFIPLLHGCALNTTNENFATYHNRALGKNISEVNHLWGYHSSEIQSPNGNKVYVYSRSRYSDGVQLPSTSTVTGYGDTAYVTTSPGAVVGRGTQVCKLWAEVDHQNILLSWRSYGQGCLLHSSWLKES